MAIASSVKSSQVSSYCVYDLPYQIVQYEEDSFSRNLLHLAAWKSDLESIELLIRTGHRFGLDLVNDIVTGDGNYGKTGRPLL